MMVLLSHVKTGALCVSLCILSVAALPAKAASVLLDVSGDNNGAQSAGTGVANDALGTSFSATSDIIIDQISFDLRCVSACQGEVVLVSGVPGPTIPARSFMQRGFFDFSGGTNSLFLFSGLSLLAGETYSIVMKPTSGNVLWYQNIVPILVETGITDGVDFRTANADPNASYRSEFEFLATDSPRFDYTITGSIVTTATPVPLPASGLLVLSAMAFGAFASRKKT